MTNIAPLLKSTSPAVAIPIEGCVPFCLDRKRLATWAKGLKRYSCEILTFWHPEVQPLPYMCEGPADLVAVVSHVLFVKHDRGWAKFLPMVRKEALSLIFKWAERQREKCPKDSLTALQRKALKRARYDEDGEGMISVMVAGKLPTDPKTERMGVPIGIPEFPLLSFVVVRFGTDSDENVRFTITETITGGQCGAGKTAEQALMDARQRASKLTPDRRAQITAKCFESAL